MQRRISILVAVIAALALTTAVAALPPKGAVRGTFTIGILAEGSPLLRYVRFSNVFCVWVRDHVFVHVTIRNSGAEQVTLEIVPRYFIARGGEHGSSLGGHESVKVGRFRSAWIDAEKPKGTPRGARISRCAPYLFSIESG
jgi:hypothetical protein